MTGSQTIYQGETYRIRYRAAADRTGLVDVKVTLYAPDGTKTLNTQTLTEEGDGFYYYIFTSTSTLGDYRGKITCKSKPKTEDVEFRVIPIIRNRVGGMISRPEWSKEEKEELLKMLKSVKSDLATLRKSKAMSAKIEETNSKVTDLKTHLEKLEKNFSKSEKSNSLRDKLILEKSDLEKLANVVDDEDI